jgi:hypothetical protein
MHNIAGVDTQALDWLLEEDADYPSVRYLALRDLEERGEDDADVISAYQASLRSGPIPVILNAKSNEGFWVKSGPGYYPKYKSLVWQIIFLAQLGADLREARVRKACDYLLEQAVGSHGGFSMSATPSGAIHCLQGNLAAALLAMGMENDERLTRALEWMACSVTDDLFNDAQGGAAPIHYYRSGISGPGFLCSANDHKPCAWGAAKVALALSKIPLKKRTQNMQKATQACLDFLLSTDPAGADYPHPYAPKPSTSWFKFGFPVFYITDVLQVLEALVDLGCAGDPRLKNAIALLLEKQDQNGRWLMEYTYNGKTWVEIEEKHKPSKWVTLRALRVLHRYFAA